MNPSDVPKWRKLTESQKQVMGNGCGGKGGWLKPPNFMFEASCNHHDFNYWIGHEEADRMRADYAFYLAMLRDVARLSWYRRWYARGLARAYFWAVRRFGQNYFNYNKQRKTWADLNKHILNFCNRSK